MRFSRSVSLISLAIFCALGLVVVSSWATRHAIGGGQRFSVGIRKSILSIAEFPTQAKSLAGLLNNYLPPKGVSNIYSGYLEASPQTNRLPGYLLLSYFNDKGSNQISLLKLSDKTKKDIVFSQDYSSDALYSDHLSASEPKRQAAILSRNRLWHPHLSKRGFLTFTIPWNDLISVNIANGKIQWKIRGAFHHSVESDIDGNIWACAALPPGVIQNGKPKEVQSSQMFEDQALVKVSAEGRILKIISVADLLSKSGLEYLLYGSSNPNVNFDPIHLNQITPILENSGLFRKGQLLISLRNLSTIALVDPEAEKILWHGAGPWMNQHSVMAIDSSTFSILDNHSFASGDFWINPSWTTRIVQHNILTKQSAEVQFNRDSPWCFKIPIEGRATQIDPHSWILEDCQHGSIMIFQDQKMVLKWSNLYPDGTVGTTSWCRYIESESLPVTFSNSFE